MLIHVGFGLLDEERWNELDQVIAELDQSSRPGKHEQFWLRVLHGNVAFNRRCRARKGFFGFASATLPLEALDDAENVRLAEGHFGLLGDATRAKEILAALAIRNWQMIYTSEVT